MPASDVLQLVGEDLLRLPGPGPWVSVKRFAVSKSGSNESVLESLIGHPDYLDFYWGDHVEGRAQSGHGPYRSDALRVGNFTLTTAAEAVSVVRWWFDELYEDLVSVRELQPAIDWITSLLAAQPLYVLASLGEADWHENGWIVGMNGFHEWIAFRDAGVDVIVASDD